MGIPNAALVAVLLFEIAIAGGITYLTWEHRERVRREMVLPLLAALLFALIWQMSTVLMLLSPTRNLQIFFHQLGWNMDFATTVPWLLFTLYYTGRDHLVTARNLAAVFLPFGALTLGMWTPQLGELYFTNYVMVGSDPAALAVDYGPLFWVAITYGYSIMGLGMVFIVEKFLNSPAYRKPIAILLGGVFIPWIASVIQFSGVIEPIRLQPTVYVVLTVFIAWYIAIFHMDVLEVLPIARDQVLDLIEEGVVVTDRTGRIIDANPAACASLGDGLVGQPLQPVLGRYVTNPEGVISDQRISREVSFEDEEETRHFELVSSPISASDAEYGEGQVGHLLLLRDVTPIREREMELRNRKEELERQNERLDKFATVISHDLRNPLTVARGFLDLARRTGDESAFENADHALDRIEEIIEGLLSLARQGQTVQDAHPLDLGIVVDEAWRTVETEGATLETRFEDVVVNADKSRLRQALENLFGNAVEHGSTSSLDASRSDDAVEQDTAEQGSTASDFPPTDEGLERRSTAPQPHGDASEGGPAGGQDADPAEDVSEQGGTNPDPRTHENAVDTGSGSAERSEDVPEPDGGDSVTVRVGCLDDGDGFYVADDGPGIPEDEREQVFETGYTTDGTGLGLAIVRDIVEAHDWEIDVTESWAGGARFEVRGVDFGADDWSPEEASE